MSGIVIKIDIHTFALYSICFFIIFNGSRISKIIRDMEPFKVNGTSQYPQIILDKDSGKFEFSGNSLPEDAKAFYDSILQWIDNYAQQPNPETVVRFKMVYYNTPSSKLLFQVLKRFEKIATMGHKITIVWAYNEDDIDIKDAGRDLAEHIKIPFKLESYKE